MADPEGQSRLRRASKRGPRRYDAAVKTLLEEYPADWLTQLHLVSPAGDSSQKLEVEVVDSDLASVTAAADKVLLVRSPQRRIVHLELQAARDYRLSARMLRYNALLFERHWLPVQSAMVLLRPAAGYSSLTGKVQYGDEEDWGVDFRFRVIRLWEQPVAPLLEGRLGTLPLAPLANVQEADLSRVATRLTERITAAEPAQSERLRAVTYILMGLRYQPNLIEHLLPDLRTMKESATYQLILSEGREDGRVQEARKILFGQGQRRLGPPSDAHRLQIEQLKSVERLEALLYRLLEVETWEQLLSS
jgi:predicted transposase YdaD